MGPWVKFLVAPSYQRFWLPTADDANGSKKGLLSGLFESRKEVTIPEGAQFEVTVDETLSSKASHAGDSYAASLSQAVVKDGKTIIPAGAHVPRG